MLVLDKNYMQMTVGFEERFEICALLLRFRKSEEGSCGFILQAAKDCL